MITVAEMEGRIAKARHEGASRKADRLAEWLETSLHFYGARVLPLDLAIAATVRLRGCTILTRNLR